MSSHERDAVPLTGPQTRALSFLSKEGKLSPAGLARLMWPDSPAWKKTARRHDKIPGAYGATMPMKAGTLLNRLSKAGMAVPDERGVWRPTKAGRAQADG